MEALVLLGVASSEELQSAMAKCYLQEYGVSLLQQWGEDWNEMFPFPQIPGFGQRAPVYPSTAWADPAMTASRLSFGIEVCQ